MAPPTRRSPRRRLTRRVVALALGVALLGGAEGLLRAGGWLDDPAPTRPTGWAEGARLVGPDSRRQLLEPYTADDGAARVRTSRTQVRDRFMHDLDWARAPSPGRPRVFCLGGSTTLGVPVEGEPARTFPGRLRHHLGRLGVDAEVLNLGGASFGSDQVVALMEAVAGDGAAAFVVYSGNNEFFNYHLELARLNEGLGPARTRVERLHLVRLLRRLLRPADAAPPSLDAMGPDEAVAAQQARLAALIEGSRQRGAVATGDDEPAGAAGATLRRGDAHAAAVLDRYAANLERMAAIAGQARPPATLFVVEVPANLDEPPWLSLHGPAVGSGDRRRVERLCADAAARLDAGDAAAAVDACEEAIARDPDWAEAHFLCGRARRQLGEREAARADLRTALELDANPGRPLAAQGAAVRALAERHAHAVRVDPGPRFTPDAEPSPFHDACHLTPAAYDALAQQLAATLLAYAPWAAPDEVAGAP